MYTRTDKPDGSGSVWRKETGEGRPIEGKATTHQSEWVTFETDANGRLLIRTLYGFKVIEDPQQATEIVQALKALAGIR